MATGDCFGAPEGKNRQAQELGSKDRDLQFYGVLLRTKELLNAAYIGKLRPRWDGPFTVTACPSPPCAAA